MKMTTDEFQEAQDEHSGYCTECDKMTALDVEPDAEEYECPDCDQEAVMGADQALLHGYITILDEDDSEVNIVSFGDDED